MMLSDCAWSNSILIVDMCELVTHVHNEFIMFKLFHVQGKDATRWTLTARDVAADVLVPQSPPSHYHSLARQAKAPAHGNIRRSRLH